MHNFDIRVSKLKSNIGTFLLLTLLFMASSSVQREYFRKQTCAMERGGEKKKKRKKGERTFKKDRNVSNIVIRFGRSSNVIRI